MKLAAIAVVLFALPAIAQEKADPRDGIRKACLDYIEGWYEGDASRMERALHPDLAKRIVRSGPNGKSNLQQMSALGLLQGVRAGYGKQTPKEKQQKDVTVLDVFENAASAKIVASDWIDYLHLARWNGEWKIVNVLWELKPQLSHAQNQK